MALDGKYVVASSQLDPAVTAADMFLTSRRRSHIETRMRYLKSQLKVRSVFLESDMRIRWLAFVTNLALDFGDASWRPVPYRESFGEHGRVIEFALERLDYWSTIVVKTLSQM